MAAIEDGPTVHFGSTGYQDFTSHGDEDRRAAYLLRHESKENLTVKGMESAGFWARWLLWNKPSLRASAADVRRRFSSLSVVISPA